MHCFVYASQRKPGTYLWLARQDNFSVLPAPLALLLGDLRFVLEVQLHVQRKLPHEDTEIVMEHLREQGWHLQLPPQETLVTPPSDPSGQKPAPQNE
ncbi:YcgL domain-containing protein [Dyella jejuensis]|uniref:YcgL domain-containing protein n=1 Tax=Dyella jejuensis TaxID=1432009 RepID=A0ABW8JJ46_9GAMM